MLDERQHGDMNMDLEDKPDALQKTSEKTSELPEAMAGDSYMQSSSETNAQPVEEHPCTNGQLVRHTTITFDPATELHKENATLYIPTPQDRDRGECLDSA